MSQRHVHIVVACDPELLSRIFHNRFQIRILLLHLAAVDLRLQRVETGLHALKRHHGFKIDPRILKHLTVHNKSVSFHIKRNRKHLAILCKHIRGSRQRILKHLQI